MKRLLKVIGLLGALMMLALLVAAALVYRFIQVGELRRFLTSEIERQTQLRVSVGEAELEMGKVLGISFSDVALMEPESDRPVITAQKALVRMALLPLLERRLVFNEVRLFRPTMRVAQDGQGKSPLLKLLDYFPAPGGTQGRFSLDVREVEIEKGEAIFTQAGDGAVPAETHLRDVELSLRRVPDAELFESSAELKSGALVQQGLGLEFAVRAVADAEAGEAGIRLRSKGKVFFPAGSSALRQAWWDAEGSAERLPAGLLWSYYYPEVPIRTIRGLLAPTLRWRGNAAARLLVEGRVDFQRLELEAPELFSGVVAPGDGRLEMQIERQPEELRFPRLEFRAGQIQLSLYGTVRRLGEDDPLLEVHLAAPFLPLTAVREYIPVKVAGAPLVEHLVRDASQGQLKLNRAGARGPLSEVRRLFEPGSASEIWLDAEVKGAAGGSPGGPYLPFREVSGRVVLENGVLSYKDFKGRYGLSRLTEVDGIQRGVVSGRKSLELRLKGDIDLLQLKDQLKAGWISAQVARSGEFLDELAGKGRLSLLVRSGADGPPQLIGQLAVDNARVRVGNVSLTQVKGDIAFSPEEIRAARLTSLLGGSPVLLTLLLSNYLTDNGAFDLSMESPGVRAGVALRPFISAVPPQDPGTVRGRIRYRGLLNGDRERSLSGVLELVGVELPLQFFRHPLREVRGRMLFDAGGVELQEARAQLAGYGFDFSGRWQYAEKPELNFTMKAPEMDIAYLLPRDDGREGDWYSRFQARGRITIGRGRFEGFEFSELSADLRLDKRVWHLDNFTARSLGGTVQGTGRFTDSSDGLAFSVESRVRDVPVDGFLKWFDMGTRQITGRINLTGKLESHGASGAERKRNLSGQFRLEIKDGLARRLEVLVRILNIMDLTRWFSFQPPDLTQKGIRFRSVTGDFKVKDGVYLTDNLVVDSDDLSITGAGQVDGPNDTMNAVLALRPFPRLGSVVSSIPLIGPGIAGIKDSVMVASFHVQGPVDAPTITPAPLSTLSEFFFSALKIPQKLIPIPGAGKK